MGGSSDFDALAARIAELEARERELADEVRELRAPRAASGTDASTDDGGVSRRRLLGLAGAAAAGAVGAVVANGVPAGATVGTMQFGADNDAATDDTGLTSTAVTQTLSVANTGSGSGLAASITSTGAQDFAARGNALTASGATIGVWGQNASLTANAAGVQGDILGLSGATFGVRGTNASVTNGAAGVKGDATAATGSVFGVVGTTSSTQGGGVRGIGAGPSPGVLGSTTAGPGVSALSDSGPSVFLQAPTLPNNGGAHLRFQTGTIVGPPTGATHSAGDHYLDQSNVLWRCAVGGSPGTWARESTLVTLPTPARVYDSRPGQPNQSPNVQGTLTFTSAPPSAANRVILCSKDASSAATVVPAGARTLLMNLTIITQSGVGALNVYANGTTQPATSNINWSAGGQLAANSVTSACDTGLSVQVAIVASAGASTHFILDVFGYYL